MEKLQQAQSFLTALFNDLKDEFIEIRLFSKTKDNPPLQRFYSSLPAVYQDLQTFLDEKNYDLYCGVCPRNNNKHGTKDSVSRVTHFWVDVDKSYFGDSLEKAMEVIRKFPLKPTLIVRTGNGYHVYWKLKISLIDKNLAEKYLKAVCSYINGDSTAAEVARVLRIPGSKNKKESDNNLDVVLCEINESNCYDLSDFDKHLQGIDIVQSNAKRNAVGWIAEALENLKEGNRNDTFTKIIGRLHHDNFSEGEIISLLMPHAQKCKYPEDELQTQVRGIAKRYEHDEAEQPKKSQSKILTELILSKGVRLINDQYQNPHAIFPECATHAININSKIFKRWVSRVAWKELDRALGQNAVNDVIAVLEGIAIHDGEQLTLHLRTAINDDCIYYSLGPGRVAKITSVKWEIVKECPVIFRQLKHQKQHPVDVISGGDISEIFEFINIDGKNILKQHLFLVWLITTFIPGFPHPPLIIYGSQGTAKSTLTALVKRIADPSEIGKMPPPHNLMDFVITASNHWVIPIDNVSMLTWWVSDSLCRVCTGDGFSKRELFSDSDEVIFSFQAVVMLNGINLSVEAPDLLDRSIILELEKIKKGKRAKEKAFWKRFEEKLPQFLGTVFDVLVKALAHYPNVNLDDYPRMADFTQWGVAITRALGKEDNVFLEAYRENIDTQNEAAINASDIAQTMIKLADETLSWKGTPTELLGKLNKIANDLNVNTKDKHWPKNSNWLWRRIERIITNLYASGVKIEHGHENGSRFIKVLKIINIDAVNDVNAVEEVNPKTIEDVM